MRWANFQDSELPELASVMAEDQHTEPAYGVNAVVRQGDGRLVGAASIGSLPLVMFWLDSRRVVPRQSVQLIASIEEQLKAQKFEAAVTAVLPSSRFYPVLPRLGLRQLGATELWGKLLR